MKPISVKEALQKLKAEPFNFIALYDSAGDAVVPFNNHGTKVDARKKEIEKKLLSSILPSGIYHLRYKNLMRDRNFKFYTIQKGTPEKGISEDIQSAKAEKVTKVSDESQSVLSWGQALQMQNTIATLTAECARLKAENENLNKQLSELEGVEAELSEIEQSNSTLSSINKVIDIASPFVEKFFTLFEQRTQAMQAIGAKTKTPAPVITSRPVNRSSTVQSVVPNIPRPAPAPQQTTVIAPAYSGGGGGGAAPGPEQPEQDAETLAIIQAMSFEDLKGYYDRLKADKNFQGITEFVAAVKQVRPEELNEIIKGDVVR